MIKPAEILKTAREKAGFDKPTEAARAHGWVESTYISHENGTRGIGKQYAKRYAKAFGIREADLLGISAAPDAEGDTERSIRVIGETAVGLWQDTTIEREREKAALRLPDVGSGTRKRQAFKAVDQSADKTISAGEYAIFEPLSSEEIAALPVNSLVIVERWRGALRERSIRRVLRKSGVKIELACHSTERRFSEAITYPSPKSTEKVEIVGRVVGKYADLI